MTTSSFDFRKPPAGRLEQEVQSWLSEGMQRANLVAEKNLAFACEFSSDSVIIDAWGPTLRQLPASTVAFPFSASADPFDQFLLTMPRTLLMVFLAGLLGDTPKAIPADRELTGVERSLGEFFLTEFVLEPLTSAWPIIEQPIQLTGKPPELPKIAWRYPEIESVLIAKLQAKLPMGTQEFGLVMTKSTRLEQLTAPPPAKLQSQPRAIQQMVESLVREMDVDLEVLLGTAELTLWDLAKLQAGDLIILKQKVTEPLEAQVSGCPKLRVWPGAVGSRQGIQIINAITERQTAS